MTEQEIFDKVADHLFTQGRRAVVNEFIEGETFPLCQYRTEDGLSCAIGCLISDAEYTTVMERKTVVGLRDSGLLSAHLRAVNVEFLAEVQYIHDNNINWGDRDSLRFAFESVARMYNLDASKVAHQTGPW